DESRYIARIVLSVAVHGGDDWALRSQDAGAHGSALPAALAMTQIAQSGQRSARDQGLHLGPGVVLAAVVDDDHLAEHLGGQHGIGLLDEAADVSGLVQSRYDHGNAHAPVGSPLRHPPMPDETRPALSEATRSDAS